MIQEPIDVPGQLVARVIAAPNLPWTVFDRHANGVGARLDYGLDLPDAQMRFHARFVFATARRHSTLASAQQTSCASIHLSAASNTSGLRRIRFHDLRHTCASTMIAEDASPLEVMKQMRYTTIQQTMDTYRHLPRQDRRPWAGSERRCLEG